MALWVQVASGNLSTATWYKGDEIENDANYWWPFNQRGANKGYMEIRNSSHPLYIEFTPANAVNLQGVILGLHFGSTSYDYVCDIVVELEESSDGGTTWTSVRSKTLNFPNDVNVGPEKQYGKYMADFRFDTSYSLNTSNQYRFKVYYQSVNHSLYLQLSRNASWSSWQSDVSDYAFRIIYSDTTGTPAASDVLVITDELTIDQDWTVGFVTILTSPAKDRLDSYNNKGSLWITATGRVYVPSSISSDITVEIRGRMYISGGDRVAWQIGDSEASPIPSNRTVNWYFNCGGTNRRAGIYAYRSSWMKIEHYGSPIEKWYAVLKEDVSSGSNQIIVEGDVTSDWQVGDEIRIGGAKYSTTRHYYDYQRDHAYYEISSLLYDSGNDETTITLSSNLAYPRDAGGRVLLMRRNVNIYGDEILSTENRADTYIYYMRWWRACWVRYHHMRYPAYYEGYNPKISLADYPHNDILKGVLIDNCKYFYIRSRKNGCLEKIATCDNRSAGWSWGEGSFILYKSKGFTITEVIGIVQYYTIQFSQSSDNELSNFWIQGQYGPYFYLSSKNKVHNGNLLNTRYGVFLSGATSNEIYDMHMKNIYADSNNSPTTQNLQGCFYYAGDMFSQDNYIHDITIENAFSIFTIDVDDGCADWYHNITYSNLTTEIYEVFRNDWIDQTRIRFTKRNGIENNDWIIYKYGEVHKTGDYTNTDDTLHRTGFGGSFALRLEPKIEGEEFSDYKILLTGAKTGKPVSYVGYVYVKSGYFDGDYDLPEIYLEGCGIDYSAEPSAKWTHPGSSYSDQWVSFTIVGTPQEDGNVYAVIKLKSNGSEPYFYIDDDIYTWPESIDWRGHEVWIDGQPSYPPAKFPVLTALEIWEQPVNTLTAENTVGKLVVDTNDEVESHRNAVEPRIDTTISSRASQDSVDAIPTNPLLDNDSRLNNLDATISSRLASNDSRLDNLDATVSSRSSHTPADVWNYSNRELTNPDNYKADVSDLAKESTVQSIKNQTDKLQFTVDNDVKVTLDGEKVSLTDTTEAQIDNIENNITNPDQYKADVSSLAKESTVQSIKSQTDKLQFTVDNDIKATLDGEKVNLTDTTESQIDNIESNVLNYDQYKADVSSLAKENTVQSIKTQTDKLTFDENSNVESIAQNSELSNLDTTISSRASQDSVDSINNTLSTLVSDIWSYSTRTLTSFGSLVSDIWNYITRTLTGDVSITNSDKDDIVDRVWDESIADHITVGTFGEKSQNKVPSENIDDYKANVSDLAKESTVQSIKVQTDKLKFNMDSDVITTLDGEKVSLTDETESQIDNIENTVTNFDQYKADVSNLALESTIQAVKAQTDKLQFNADNDVKATLDGEGVNLTSTTESQIDNIENNIVNHDQYKADISNLALETTVQSIKFQTDKLQFDISNNVQARVNDKGVLNNPSTDEIADAVWDEMTSDHTTSGSFGEEVQSHTTKAELDQAEANIRGTDGDTLKNLSDQIDSVKEQTDKISIIQLDVSFIKDIEGGRWVRDGHQMIFYKDDNTTEIARFDLYKKDGNLAEEDEDVFERRRI